VPDRSLDDTVRALTAAVGRNEGEGLRGEIHSERAERRQQTGRIVRWVAAAMALVVVVGASILAVGFAWTNSRVDSNSAKLARILHAACAKDLDFVLLPAKAIEVSHRPPSPVLVDIARDSRAEFLAFGCPDAANPRTGRPFGPPPEVRTK
jgi:hypothetical protein